MSIEMNEAAKKESGEEKEGIFEKVKQRVSEFDQKQHAKNEARRKEKEELNAMTKDAEKKAFRESYVKAKVAKAREKGARAGAASFGGGAFGKLEGAASFAQKHVGVFDDAANGKMEKEIGFGSISTGGGFGMSPDIGRINASLGLGPERRPVHRKATKSKKRTTRRRDPYAGFGF